jgi:hypothetical protein
LQNEWLHVNWHGLSHSPKQMEHSIVLSVLLRTDTARPVFIPFVSLLCGWFRRRCIRLIDPS